jgi:integrase
MPAASTDTPQLTRGSDWLPLPRYLPPDADQALRATLQQMSDSGPAVLTRLHADALLLARATGLRIGELRDLELDCVHQIDGHGAWLKVPLGKLASERMVPLDEETVAVIDHIVARRTSGRPLPHPRTGRPVDFLLVHQGRRISACALREELSRAADTADLGKVTPHALRHTFVITPAVTARGTAKSGIRRLVPHGYLTLPRHVWQGRDQALSSSLLFFRLTCLPCLVHRNRL